MEKHVLVFGSYVTDLCGRTSCIPQAGETVKGHYFKLGPGGKGSNQAVAAKRAGAKVTFITKLGDDALGKQAMEFYKEEDLAGDGILIDKEDQTGVALIIVNEANAQNQIVVIGGACEHFTEDDLPSVLEKVEKSDILLIQLETNLEPIRAVLKHAKIHGVLTVMNPAPAQHLEDEIFELVDIIIPNETEAQFYTGVRVIDEESAHDAAKKLMANGVSKVIITMGSKGCYACDQETERFFDIVNCGEPVDTTGAGDAFSGGFVAALAKGFAFYNAVVYGSCVSGLAVTRHGTAPAMPYNNEIEQVFESLKN